MDDLTENSSQQIEHDLAAASSDQQGLQCFDAFVNDSSFGLPSGCRALLFYEEPRAEHHVPSGCDMVTDCLLSPFDTPHSVQDFQLESGDLLYEGSGVFPDAWIDTGSTFDANKQQQPRTSPYFTPSATWTSFSTSAIAISPPSEISSTQQDSDTFLLDLSNNDLIVPFKDASLISFPQKRKREIKTTSSNTLDSEQSQYLRSSQDNEIEAIHQTSVQHDGEAPLQSGSVFAACHLWLSTHSNQHPPEYVLSGLAFAFQVPFDKIRQWFRIQLRGVLPSPPLAFQSPPELSKNELPSSIAIAACHIWLSTHLNAMPPEHVIFALSLAFDSPFDSLCNWFRVQFKVGCRTRTKMDSDSAFLYRTNQHKCNKNNYDHAGTALHFSRDKDKPYACTSRCGRNFRTKDDWRKHEEINYPQKIWICQFQGCAAKSQEKRVKFLKEHFKKHLELYHNEETLDENEVDKSCITIDSIFNRECLFHGCNTVLHTWKDRINHIAKHFNTQSWSSSEWRLSKDSILVADSGARIRNIRPTSPSGGKGTLEYGLRLNGEENNADPKALSGLLRTNHVTSP